MQPRAATADVNGCRCLCRTPAYREQQQITGCRACRPPPGYSETWPFFRPNFQNMEAYRQEWGADEVR